MSSYTPTGTSTINGADCYASGNTLNYHTESFWRNTVFGTTDYDTNWYWDRTANLPKLRVFLKPPSIATPTGSATVQSGQPLTISAALTNPSGLNVNYLWQVSTDGTTWGDTGTSGQTTLTSDTLTYTPTTTISTASQTYYWRVVWTSDYSSTQSATQAFSTVVYNVPTQPTTLTASPTGVKPTGTAITLSVSGEQYTTTYDWYQRPSGSSESGTQIGSATSTATTTFTPVTTGTYQIGVIVKNGEYATQTIKWFDSPTIRIYNEPIITNTQVSPNSVMYKTPTSVNLSASVNVSASGSPIYYHWYEKRPGSSWASISGATSATSPLGIKTYTSLDNYQYLLRVTWIGGYVDSPIVTLTVQNYDAPTIINARLVNPASGETDTGSAFTLSLSADVSDPGAIAGVQATTYQWYVKGPTDSSFTPIQGATSATITKQEAYYVAGTYNYQLVATGIGGPTTSSETISLVAKTPIPPPVVNITISPTSGEIVSSLGTTFVINLEASENDPYNTITYRQWQILSPAAGASWQDTGVINPRGSYRLDTAQAGTYYFKYVTRGLYTVNSSVKAFNVTKSSWVREMATATISPVSTQPVNNLIDSIDVTPGNYFDPIDVFEQLLWPYTQGDDLLNSLILLCIFAVPIFMVWLITKNILVPSIIGLIFGVWLLTFLPAGYYGVSVALIALSIVGGIIRIFKPPQ